MNFYNLVLHTYHSHIMANLAALGRQHYVSQHGLSSILQEIQKNGLPKQLSRQSVKRAREEELEKNASVTHGALVKEQEFQLVNEHGKMVPGSPNIKLPVISPLAFLQAALERDAYKAYFLKHLINEGLTPQDPLKIVVYADEIAPGNQLRHDQTRKVQICYWAIQQGPGISVDQLWFTLAIARSCKVSCQKGPQIQGGMAAWMKGILQHFISPIDMRKGFHVIIDGVSHLRFAAFSMVLADEAALKDIFGFKGASAIHICPLCINIVNVTSNLHKHDGSLEASTCTDLTKWQGATDARIKGTLQHLHNTAGTTSKKDFEDLEKFSGWNYNPFGVLGAGEDTALGIYPRSHMQYDWMHTLSVHGCWNIELGALLPHLKQVGLTQHNLHEYLQTITWPEQIGARAATGKMIFRKKQEGHVKCSASEALSSYSPIRSFLLDNMSLCGPIMDFVASYLYLCEVFDVVAAVRRGTAGPNEFHLAISKYVQKHLQAYGDSVWVPKFHYLQHLPEMLNRHKRLIGCFVHERKHRIAKRFLENMRTIGQGFEVSILKDVLHCNLHDLQHKDIGLLEDGLVDPILSGGPLQQMLRMAMDSNEDVYHALKAHYAFGALATVGDILKMQNNVIGEAQFFASTGGECRVCMILFQNMRNRQLSKTNQKQLFCLEDIQETLVYKRLTDTVIQLV